LHASSVQPLASPQLRGAPTQVPLRHASPTEHALWSSHGAVLKACVHPVSGLQPSVVQTSPSSQSGAEPPTHAPPAHVSFVVQRLPSSQGTELFVFTQPIDGLQVSVVQTFPSLQSSAGPPWQEPPPQVSSVVQALPSSHAALLLTCVQPVSGLHPSSVHGFESSQSTGSLVQAWATQRLFWVQASVSLQSMSRLQHGPPTG